MSRTHRRRATPVVLLLALALAAVAAGAALLFAPHPTSDAAAAPALPTVVTPEGALNTAGSTRGAASTSSAPFTIKAEPKHVATDTPVPTPSEGRVRVTLTYAGFQMASKTVQANGFAAGIIENGGTCTLTLTQAGSVVTATSTAAADATTTSCGLLETAPGLAPGTWRAVLSYSSKSAHGSSEPLDVRVR